MVITHIKDNEKFHLKVDYDSLIGDWCNKLTNYLHSDYSTTLMFSIHHLFSNMNLNKRIIQKKDIFKAYKLCQPDDTRVVIINCNAMFNSRSNGLAFGNKSSLRDDYDEKSIELFNVIEQIQDDNFKVDKDYTLETWAKQGVLLLNYPLMDVSETQKIKFHNLIASTIEYLNSKSGIIFCLVNNRNNFFRAKIFDKTNVLINSESLNYTLLASINNHIEQMNGKDSRIRW